MLLRDQLVREEENIETFRESYSRTEERFYNGKVTSLDLRDAQNALLNAEITISNLKADILKSTLRLEGLKGSLMKKYVEDTPISSRYRVFEVNENADSH